MMRTHTRRYADQQYCSHKNRTAATIRPPTHLVPDSGCNLCAISRPCGKARIHPTDVITPPFPSADPFAHNECMAAGAAEGAASPHGPHARACRYAGATLLRQPVQADGAYKRACGPVPGEPRERELVYADVQQRVHRIRELLVFGRSAFRCISQPPHPAYPPGPAVRRISCSCAINACMDKCCSRYGRGPRGRVRKQVRGCGQARG